MSNRRKIGVRHRKTAPVDVAIQGVFAEATKLVEDALARVALNPDESYRKGFREGALEMKELMIDATYRATKLERELQ